MDIENIQDEAEGLKGLIWEYIDNCGIEETKLAIKTKDIMNYLLDLLDELAED